MSPSVQRKLLDQLQFHRNASPYLVWKRKGGERRENLLQMCVMKAQRMTERFVQSEEKTRKIGYVYSEKERFEVNQLCVVPV